MHSCSILGCFVSLFAVFGCVVSVTFSGGFAKLDSRTECKHRKAHNQTTNGNGDDEWHLMAVQPPNRPSLEWHSNCGNRMCRIATNLWSTGIDLSLDQTHGSCVPEWLNIRRVRHLKRIYVHEWLYIARNYYCQKVYIKWCDVLLVVVRACASNRMSFAIIRVFLSSSF